MVKNILISLSFCCFLFSSCIWGGETDEDDSDNDSTEVDTLGLEQLDLFEDEEIPDAADMLFDDFFYSFVSDANYQVERTKNGVVFDAFDRNPQKSFVVIYERDEDLILPKDTAITCVSLEELEWENMNVHSYMFNRIKNKWYLTEEKECDVSETPNSQFYQFLSQFVTDSLFQCEAIDFPLPLNVYSYEDEEMLETELELDEWKALWAEMPNMENGMVNVDYGQTLISRNRKSLQLKSLESDMIMTFHFDLTNGEWKLIGVGN